MSMEIGAHLNGRQVLFFGLWNVEVVAMVSDVKQGPLGEDHGEHSVMKQRVTIPAYQIINIESDGEDF